jgi:parallel beta-helix repeat protein
MALVVMVTAAILLFQSGEAQTDPPASGDWTVGDVTVLENRTVDLRGNLTVSSGGDLTLRNVTLRIHSTLQLVHGIRVLDNGSLRITDLDGVPSTTDDRSLVTRGNPSRGFEFLAVAGSSLALENSLVNGAGGTGGLGGVLVRTSDLNMEGMTFLNGDQFALKLDGTGPSFINRSMFLGSRHGLVLEGCDNVTVVGCNLSLNDGSGLLLTDSNGTTVVDSNISENAWGVVVTGGHANTIESCLIEGSSIGIRLVATERFSMDGSTVTDTTYEGASISGGTQDVIINGSSVYSCSRSGLEVDGVINLTISDTVVGNNGYYGVRILNGSASIHLLRAQVSWNDYDGVHIERASDVHFTGGSYVRNGYNGVFLVDVTNATFKETSHRNNTYDGLNCDTTVGLELDSVDARSNGYSGISLQAGTDGAFLVNCEARLNTRSGLWLDSVFNISIELMDIHNNSGYGLRVEGGSLNISGRVRIVDNTGGVVRVQDSGGVYLNDSLLDANGTGYLFYGRNARNVWVSNSTTNGTAHLINRCNVSLLVCTFDDVTPDVDGSSHLHFLTLVDVEVIWPNDTPVQEAQVNATGRGGQVLLEGLTDATGRTGEHPLLMESHIGESVAFQNPYTFWARKGSEVARNETNVLGRGEVQIVLQDNMPPHAVAPDMTVELNHPTKLNGTASSDNGQLVAWLWTFDDGVGTVVLEGAMVNWTFTVLGNFTGTLEVTDSVGLTDETTFTIAVVDTTPPDVEAGANATVDQGKEVTADARGTTDNDSTLLATGRFIWRVTAAEDGSGERLFSGPIVTIPFPEMGTFLVELNVSDQSGNWAIDRFWVTVNDTTAPVVDAGPDIEVDEGAPVVLEPASVTDNDPEFDAALTSWWEVKGPGTDLVLDGLSASFVAPTMGEYTATLHVTDAAGNEGTGSRRVMALDVRPPVVDIGNDRTVEVLSEVALDAGNVTDNDPVFPEGASYRWVISGPQLEHEHRGDRVTFTVPWVGDYTVSLFVTDAAGNEGSTTVTVTSVDTVAPEFGQFSPSPGDTSKGMDVTITFVITDVGTGVDGDTVEMRTRSPEDEGWSEWQRVSVEGSGNRVEETMVLQFPEGVSHVQLRCWDRAGNGPVVSDEHLIRVNSRPRVVVLAPLDGAKYGPTDLVLLDASASTDVDGDELIFRWSSNVDGVLGTNATVRTAPLTEGDHVITVSVTDGVPGHEVLVQVNITVLPVPSTVDGDDDVPWWVVIAILLLLLATALVVWDHGRRRRRPPPPEEAEEWVETPEEEDWAPSMHLKSGQLE